MRVLLALVVFVACSDGEPPRAIPAPEISVEAPPSSADRPSTSRPSRTVVWIGGDVLLSGAIRRFARDEGDPADGFSRILGPVTQQWRVDGNDAFVVVNLESPVARETRNDRERYLHTKQGPARVPTPLNAPRWLLDGLARSGVDAVMLANNHALDQERAGLAETIEAAHEAGLVTTGAGIAPNLGWPIVVGPQGVETAVLSYFEKDYPEPDLPAGEAGLSVLGPHSIDEVRAAAAEHDAVVVIVHVVAELLEWAKPRWRDWARELAAAGADAIALHGTHVPGPVEVLDVDGRSVTVAYGLGNFLSDMGASASPSQEVPNGSKWDAPQTRESLLMRVEVTPTGVSTTFLPLFMHHDRWLVHNRLAELPIRFRLTALSACGTALDVEAGWPPGSFSEPWREELSTWIDQRRDHLLTVSRLSASGCRAGEVTLLRPASIRGTM